MGSWAAVGADCIHFTVANNHDKLAKAFLAGIIEAGVATTIQFVPGST